MDGNGGAPQLKRKKKALHRLIDAANETKEGPTDEQNPFARPAPTLDDIRDALLHKGEDSD